MGWLSLFIEQEADALMRKKILAFRGMAVANRHPAALFAKQSSINGFDFLAFTLLAKLEVDVFKGCEVEIQAEGISLTVESDTQRILSDYSASIGYGLTEFEIDLEDDLRELLLTRDLQYVRIRFGKRQPVVLDVPSMKEFRIVLGAGGLTEA